MAWRTVLGAQASEGPMSWGGHRGVVGTVGRSQPTRGAGVAVTVFTRDARSLDFYVQLSQFLNTQREPRGEAPQQPLILQISSLRLPQPCCWAQGWST